MTYNLPSHPSPCFLGSTVIRTERSLCFSSVVLILGLTVTACSPSRDGPLDVSTPADQEVRVTLNDNFTLTASPATVRAGRVKFIATNAGATMHGFGIEGIGIEQFISPGTSLTQETVFRSGTWILYCPVADHYDRGMQTQVVVG